MITHFGTAGDLQPGDFLDTFGDDTPGRVMVTMSSGVDHVETTDGTTTIKLVSGRHFPADSDHPVMYRRVAS